MSEQRLALRLPEVPAGVRLRPGADALANILDERVEAARREGHARGRAELAARLDSVLAAVGTAEQEAAELLASTAVGLARSIAERIVRREIEEGRYELEAIVRESLHASGVGRGEVAVHLNPTDAASLADVTFRAGTTIEPDADVPRGDVHVVTQLGVLVRDAEEMIGSIVERVRDEFGA